MPTQAPLCPHQKSKGTADVGAFSKLAVTARDPPRPHSPSSWAAAARGPLRL